MSIFYNKTGNFLGKVMKIKNFQISFQKWGIYFVINNREIQYRKTIHSSQAPQKNK